ncbi:MAG: rhodanese-like domain-containing protein [Candidatus Moraniibacteriota bacterium]
MYKQKAEYQKWLVESQKYSIQQNDNSSFDIASTNQINDKLQITNQEFKNAIDSKINNFIVLDARENIEYENGYFPGSLRIRFADLRDGQWDKLPKDKIVYVICWSGIRGKEAVEFLRTKNVRAFYLENGASGWVEFGGAWIGGIKFLERYTDKKYKIVFNTDEVRKMAKEGVILVDTREPDKFKKWHISGSVNIPIMYTPTSNIEIVFGQVPIKSRVITVCDGYVNCFDAKITGVELEKRGHQFLGRYNKPWEYGK